MIRYLLPGNLEHYLEARVRDPIQVEGILAKLQQMMIEGSALTKKQGPYQTFYTLNVDYGRHAHRAIFELVKMNDEPYFLLRDFVWAHHYRAALRWTPLHTVTEQNLHDLYRDAYQIITTHHVDEPQEIKQENEVYYQGHWLTLTPLQQEIMDNAHYPALLIGPPGSGKTLLAMRLLQEQALLHFDNQHDETIQLLYITESPVLVAQMRAQWLDFFSHTFPQDYRGVVAHFVTNTEYIRQYTDATHQVIDESLFSNLSHEQKEELVHNAYYLDRDVQANCSFEKSEYSRVGLRNTLFTAEQKNVFYAKMCGVLKHCGERGLFLPNVSSMTNPPHHYDFIVVDEAQKASLTLLVSLLKASHASQVLYIGDSLQKGGDYFSVLASLGACVLRETGITLSIHHLQSSLRLKADVARMVNELVKLYGHVNGGKADAVSYAHIDSELTETPPESAYIQLCHPLQSHIHEAAIQQQFHQNPRDYKTARITHWADITSDVREQEETLAIIGQDAHAAAIILAEADRMPARVLIQGHNVFTAHEARGLEFSKSLLYLSATTIERFKNIATFMKSKGITAEQFLEPLKNQSPHKEKKDGDSLGMLSDLLIALSRTRGHLYVYMETPASIHAISPFLPWLQKRLGGEVGFIKIHPIQSSQEDWLEAIHRFIREGAEIQAKENLMNIFTLKAEDASEYIQLCRSQASLMPLSEFMDWCESRTKLVPVYQSAESKEDESLLAAVKPKKKSRKKSPPLPVVLESVSVASESMPVCTEQKIGLSYSKVLSKSFCSQEPESRDITHQRIGKVIEDLKKDFTIQRYDISMSVIAKLDSDFWSSDLAKDLVLYIASQPEKHHVIFNYYACCDLEAYHTKTLSNIEFHLAENEQYCQFRITIKLLLELRIKYKEDIILGDSLSSDKLSLAHILAYKQAVPDLIILSRISKVALNKTTFRTKETAAMIAVRSGDCELLKVLVSLGADMRQSLPNKSSFAHIAVKFNQEKMLPVLKECGVDINQFNSDGATPAHIAIFLNRNTMLPVLKDLGADFNIFSQSSLLSPVHYAAELGNDEALEIMHSMQVDLDRPALNGVRPAHLAAMHNRPSTLRKLLQSGADLNAVTTKEGFSVLHYAALYSSDKVLKWIKSKDRVKVNLDLTTTDGDTALHIAIMKGDIDTVKLVIDLGVDLNKPTQYGVSPIFLAVEFGYFAILKYLCQKNVSVHGVVTLTRKELLKTMDGHITIPLRSSWSNLNSYLEQAGVTQDDARCTLTLLEIARIMKHDDIANFIGKIAGSRASSHSSGQTSVSKDAEKRVGLGQSMK